MKQFSLLLSENIPADKFAEAMKATKCLGGGENTWSQVVVDVRNGHYIAAAEDAQRIVNDPSLSLPENEKAECGHADDGVVFKNVNITVALLRRRGRQVYLYVFANDDITETAIRMLTPLALAGSRYASILLAAAARDHASNLNANVQLPRGLDYTFPASLLDDELPFSYG